jgi:hypothetical protein
MGTYYSDFWNTERRKRDEEFKHHDAGYLYTLLRIVLANGLRDIQVLVLVSVHTC